MLQAPDFKTARNKLQHNDIDVVLCDVKLPNGNGVELSKKVKDQDPTLELILHTSIREN